jgi:ribosomal protein S18 acetylase RimI-like enzyme
MALHNASDMNTDVDIRWATVEDARAIAAVHIASWRAAYRGILSDRTLDELTLDGRERDWRGWLAEGGERQHTLVAERDGVIEALCTVELPSREEDEPEDVAGIPALYAHPDAFGRGAGPALTDAAIEVVRDRDCREAILWMLDGNRRAQAFYERHGWRRDGGARPAEGYPGLTSASEAEHPREVRYRRLLEIP